MSVIDESSRQRALDLYRVVDTLPEAAYDDIVRLAAAICDVPIALVSLIDRDRQWFKARLGLDLAETPRDEAVCDHAILYPGAMLEVEDLSHDPRFAHLPLVVGEQGIRFYAGMPLVTPGGAAIGTVCVIDRAPRTLNDEQRGALEALARLTINLMESGQRERVLERAVQHCAGFHDATPYTVAVLQVQALDRLAAEVGLRRLELQLQQLDEALEAALDPGDTLNRTSGSGEYVAVLKGEGVDTRARLRAVLDAVAGAHGWRVALGTATSQHDDESQELVFLRADAALSADKDRLARH